MLATPEVAEGYVCEITAKSAEEVQVRFQELQGGTIWSKTKYCWCEIWGLYQFDINKKCSPPDGPSCIQDWASARGPGLG